MLLSWLTDGGDDAAAAAVHDIKDEKITRTALRTRMTRMKMMMIKDDLHWHADVEELTIVSLIRIVPENT